MDSRADCDQGQCTTDVARSHQKRVCGVENGELSKADRAINWAGCPARTELREYTQPNNVLMLSTDLKLGSVSRLLVDAKRATPPPALSVQH